MFGFGKRRIAGRRADIEDFRVSLVSSEKTIVDLTSAVTMFWADHLESERLYLYHMQDLLADRPNYDEILLHMIRQLAKTGRDEEALGLTVWLHTAHALKHPECRDAGRLLWVELSKSSEAAEVIARRMCFENGRPEAKLSRRRIPDGLGQ